MRRLLPLATPAILLMLITTSGGPALADNGNGSRSVEIDSSAPNSTSKPPERAENERERADRDTALRLFDEHKWVDAAIAGYRISKDARYSRSDRELALYATAASLAHMKMYQSAYGIFSVIADEPNHSKHDETLLWLGRLSAHLPEPADIFERVGKYDEAAIQQAKRQVATEDAMLASELYYLLARYKYRNRDFEGAIRIFAKVDVESPRYIKSQFWTGLSSVQLRKPIPAVQAFQRVIRVLEARAAARDSAAASDDDREQHDDVDDDRMRDLAFLSMARTYYSAGITNYGNSGLSVDEAHLALAVKYWSKVDAGGPVWLDALFEESWAYFMLNDYARTLGNIVTLEAPYFPSSYFPEAGVLKALVYFVNCHYTEAETLVARFQQTWQPYRNDLIALRDRFRAEDPSEVGFALLRGIRDGKATNMTPRVQKLAELTLSDRELSRHLQYVQILDDEHRSLERMPPSFRDSSLGSELRDGLLLTHDLAVQNATELARARVQRKLSELDEHLASGRQLAFNILDARTRDGERGPNASGDGTIRAVDADDEHVLWPFNGEYWRDELGQYKQSITSKCSSTWGSAPNPAPRSTR